MSVQEYLEKHKLSQKIEDAVNAAVRAKSSDPVLFISNHMKKTCISTIQKIKARQIIDSRGNPTVEVDLYTGKGMFRSAVPSGASTGVHEAVELRDGDKSRYLGKGVLKAVSNINDKIGPALINMDPTQQAQIDKIMIDMDKTDNKGNLGANAILAVSMAVCKAGAAEKDVPLYQHIADLGGITRLVLPVPAFNIINGGSHAGNRLAMQEFMILPTGAPTFGEALRYGAEVYHHLKTKRGGSPHSSNKEGLDLVKEAIERAGFTGKIKIGMDVAASEFLTDDKKYDLDFKSANNNGSEKKSGAEMIDLYKSFCTEYPIISIEDPFDQDDWENTKALTSLGICQVVGDDLLVTNPKRVMKAIQEKTCNALLLKVNQIGSVTEAIQAVNMSKDAGWGVMCSHRSGETEDSFIADLAVGLATGQIKTGAPCRSERLAKYNQLLRIEEELGDKAIFAGENWRPKLGAAPPAGSAAAAPAAAK
ncbi:hypothetical protein AXG93_1593s1240 [Marchantia polymorpha subsp. ruderalis]|uniref:phosphopyruvate hydratase n=1 Tax=Marchantia polymorpha subsp. ruderalis TaxID=1480154 RepID=A0A176WNW3_MARPO|nr:hypothetical protein AXG93_1593s1240 [Marchantia polymorpha subsp. ruderalis]